MKTTLKRIKAGQYWILANGFKVGQIRRMELYHLLTNTKKLGWKYIYRLPRRGIHSNLGAFKTLALCKSAVDSHFTGWKPEQFTRDTVSEENFTTE